VIGLTRKTATIVPMSSAPTNPRIVRPTVVSTPFSRNDELSPSICQIWFT